MKKIILIGNIASGKTTLCQYLNNMDLTYKKTQSVEVYQGMIDTPGEYLENRVFFRSLMVMSAETDQVLFVQDASSERYCFSPGQAGAFPLPVAGVVTKTDIATEQEIRNARELLELAGASPVFEVSAYSGAGMEELTAFLECEPRK